MTAFSFKPAWCAECGERFQPHKSTERFCSCDCRKTYHNRRIVCRNGDDVNDRTISIADITVEVVTSSCT